MALQAVKSIEGSIGRGQRAEDVRAVGNELSQEDAGEDYRKEESEHQVRNPPRRVVMETGPSMAHVEPGDRWVVYRFVGIVFGREMALTSVQVVCRIEVRNVQRPHPASSIT
jgi:hypothetical protein